MKIKLHHALLITKNTVLNSFKYIYSVLIRNSLFCLCSVVAKRTFSILKNIENGFDLSICKNIFKPNKILKSSRVLSG